MTRPLRIEIPGALYHITARGNRLNPIYRDDTDRQIWLEVLALVCDRFHFVVHAYCQMTNHYHVMIETVEGNLAQGMRQLNGAYAQRFNRRHVQVGHVFQGRYHAVLVQKESHLLELARYIALNPVRAGIVGRPDEWRWSSYHSMLDSSCAPIWLETAWLLGQFGQGKEAADAFAQFVFAGVGIESPLRRTRFQLLLGDDDFSARYREPRSRAALVAVSKPQRRITALTLAQYEAKFPPREAAMARAYRSTAFTMAEISVHFGVSAKTVSRAVRLFEGALRE
ncbi:REP-associated tyrosine transposase [Massilia sp. TWR1-2-2]|uniref:REP-associated tyrosine transposase n=1 Tax=Massilia sp. TWR1-2-2 TaxID=2804584 RepID=UPI003CF03B75